MSEGKNCSTTYHDETYSYHFHHTSRIANDDQEYHRKLGTFQHLLELNLVRFDSSDFHYRCQPFETVDLERDLKQSFQV
jgi:hypothetical protein